MVAKGAVWVVWEGKHEPSLVAICANREAARRIQKQDMAAQRKHPTIYKRRIQKEALVA